MLVLLPAAEAQQVTAKEGDGSDDSDNSSGGAALFLKQLVRVPAGTPLYDVFAVVSPDAIDPAIAARGGLVRVGRLCSTSRFLRSGAEADLTFWHQRKEEDYALRQDWSAQVGQEHANACGAEHFARMIAKRQHT